MYEVQSIQRRGSGWVRRYSTPNWELAHKWGMALRNLGNPMVRIVKIETVWEF